MRLLIAVALVACLAGCASDEKRNPMEGKDRAKIWWRGKYKWKTVEHKVPNIYDPWAEDDLSKYANGKIVVPSDAAKAPKEEAPPAEPTRRTF